MAPPSQPPSLLLQRIVWGALLASTCVYAFVLFFLNQGEWAAADPPPPSDLPTILAGMGLVTAPLIFVMRRSLLGSVALGPPDATNETEVASDDALDSALLKALSQYNTGTIVGLAFADSAAFFGLVGAFQAQDPMLFLPGWTLATLLLAVQFPRWQGVAHLLTPPERAALYAREGLSLRA
jgi:hypothetical protein